MHLKRGEGELQSAKAIIKGFLVGDKDVKDSLEATEGMLYLTNRRLLMEKEKPATEPILIFEFPLEALQKAETRGVFGKCIQLEVNVGKMNMGWKEKKPELQEGFGQLSLKVRDPATWAGQLNRAIRSRKEES